MSDHILTLERRMAASPAAVWRCLTEPALIEQWFAPKPVRVTNVTFEAVPGGAFASTMDIPGAGQVVGESCVLVAIPYERLVWTSVMRGGFVPSEMKEQDGAFPFTADITLAAQDDGCLYRVQVLHPNAIYRETHEQMGFATGWGAAADQLETLALTL